MLALVLALLPTAPVPTPLPAPFEARPSLQQADELAAEEELERRLRDSSETLRREALALATSATEADYHSLARGIWETIVALDPDNAAARKGLGMRFRNGEWVQRSSRPKRDKVEDEDRVALEERRRAIVERAIVRIDAAFQPLKPTPRRSERWRRELEALLPMDPEHEALRERAGFLRAPDSETWELAEVVIARRNLTRNQELLERVRAALPGTEAMELDFSARRADVPFAATLGSAELVVSATTNAAEARQLHDVILTLHAFLQGTFEREPQFQMPAAIYSFGDERSKRAFIQNHEGIADGEEDEHLSLAGSWIRRALLVSPTTLEERIDMACFLTAIVYQRLVFGPDTELGWVRQSLASYLSASVCGTHLSFLVTKDLYGQTGSTPWPKRVPPTLGGWARLARPFLEPTKPLSDFARALSAPTRTMVWEDVAIGYAFSAYLFEGRRDDLVRILDRVGRSEETIAVIEDVLQMPLPAIRDRLAAWLEAVGEED